jgi:hypothetical protein
MALNLEKSIHYFASGAIDSTGAGEWDGALEMGARMHKWILMVSLLIGATAQAHATTYEYTGAQFTNFSGLCGPGSCTKSIRLRDV